MTKAYFRYLFPFSFLFLTFLSPAFAAGAAPAFLIELVELVLASAIMAYICHRLGLVPIIGFLIAGIIIGPNALGLIQDRELIDATAEIGVILLLFTIGIEFSLEKLAQIKKLIFVGGGLQLLLTTSLVVAGLAFFDIDYKVGIFTGFLVTLSSTAIVLKLLASRGETNSTPGKVSLGLLIFQDLAIIVMVMLIPMLAGQGGSALGIGLALGKAAILIVVVLWLARKLMPIILEKVAQTCSAELFLLSVIAICFGTAYLTSLADVSVSLGAFLAGLIVSESRFSQHAFSEILPLQILFSATFFVSVGMLLDTMFLMDHILIVLAAVAVVLVLKAITTALSVMTLGYPFHIAFASSLMLAQVGEFSFVLVSAGRDLGLTPMGMGEAGSQAFIASTVVLMVLTPFLTQIGMRLSGKMQARQAKMALDEAESELTLPVEIPHMENHVIIAGYGKAARKLTRVLMNSEISFNVITLNPDGAREAESHGIVVLRGDPVRQRTLILAGIERAKLLVIPDDDPEKAHQIAAVSKVTNPTVQVIARTRSISEIAHLTEAGVDRVIPEELEGIVQLLRGILLDYHLPMDEVTANLESVRSGNYLMIRTPESNVSSQSVIDCHSINQDCLDTRTINILPGAPVVGQTLSSLQLNKQFGVLVTNVIRGNTQYNIPQASFALVQGDHIEMSGTAEGFRKAAHLFRGEVTENASPNPSSAPHAGSHIDLEESIELVPDANADCSHTDRIRKVLPSAKGCEKCLQEGEGWVHLRICMTCGHVGCCDSSNGKHAAKHFQETGHPIARSLEPDESWGWCYIEKNML